MENNPENIKIEAEEKEEEKIEEVAGKEVVEEKISEEDIAKQEAEIKAQDEQDKEDLARAREDIKKILGQGLGEGKETLEEMHERLFAEEQSKLEKEIMEDKETEEVFKPDVLSEEEIRRKEEYEDAGETARMVIEQRRKTIEQRTEGLSPKEQEEYIRRRTGGETKEEEIENLTKDIIEGNEKHKQEELRKAREKYKEE